MQIRFTALAWRIVEFFLGISKYQKLVYEILGYVKYMDKYHKGIYVTPHPLPTDFPTNFS